MKISTSFHATKRHLIVEQALVSYNKLRLLYPAVAERMRTAAFHVKERPALSEEAEQDFSKMLSEIFRYDPLPVEQEAENEQLRNLLRATAALISKSYYASGDPDLKHEEAYSLREHADYAIATMVGDIWRCFEQAKYYFHDPDLRLKVEELVRRRAKFEEATPKNTEEVNAQA